MPNSTYDFNFIFGVNLDPCVHHAMEGYTELKNIYVAE